MKLEQFSRNLLFRYQNRALFLKTELVMDVIHQHSSVVNNLTIYFQPEMIGHYLGEFSITYKPVKHGRPGIGATHSSRFIPLK